MLGKSLRYALLASGLALTTAISLSPAAFAAETANSEKPLEGKIAADVTLTWNYTPSQFTVSTSGTGTHSLGTVSTTSNVLYTVKAASTNGGLLTHTDETTTISYTLTLAGGEANVSPIKLGDVIYDSAGTNTPLSTAALTLNLASGANKRAGVYSDSVTLSIAAQ